MGTTKYMRSYLLLILIPIASAYISKRHLESLLSHIFFKGYDLIISATKDSHNEILSWLKEGNHSFFSLVVFDPNFTESVDDVRHRSRASSQIAVIIEFQNVSHLESQVKNYKTYNTKTTVPQAVYYVIAPTPEIFNEILNNEKGLSAISNEFPINSHFYFFGEELDTTVGNGKKRSNKVYLNNLQTQGFIGHLFPPGFGLAELYSLKNMTFLELVDLKQTNMMQHVIRRSDFRKAPISAVAQYGYFPRANFTSDNSTFTTGYEVDQLNFLASSFNFTTVAKVGTGWIYEDSNNKLTGMGAQVIDREADISISSSEMLAYRAAQLTFLHPTYYITIWSFFKQPTSNSLRDIFINAFTLDLWLTMFATWFLIIMTMFALAIVKWRLGTLQENDKIVLQEVFIWAAGAICQQGWHVCPESGCLKIVFIFALITGLVSYVGYSAALVSILSVKVIPIQSLSDLVSYRYTIYQDNQTISTKHVIQDLESSGSIKTMPFSERSIRSEEAVKKILSSQTAFLGVTDLFYPAALANLCTDLQDRILLMYERGIRYRLLENYFRDESVLCLDLNASQKQPLGFNDVVTAYVILLLGYMISLTIFVVEKLCKTNLSDNNISSEIYYTN